MKQKQETEFQSLSVKIPKSLHADLKIAAIKKGQNLTNYITKVLKESMKSQEK